MTRHDYEAALAAGAHASRVARNWAAASTVLMLAVMAVACARGGF